MEELSQYYTLIEGKLDPLLKVLKNVNTFILGSEGQDDMLPQTSALMAKVNRALELSKVLTHTPKERPAILEVLFNMAKELTFDGEPILPDDTEVLTRELQLLKIENQQLIDEIQLWHTTIQDEVRHSNDLSELVRALTEKDKLIEHFKAEIEQLMIQLRVQNKCDKFIPQLEYRLRQVEHRCRELEQREEQHHNLLMYRELAIDSLRDQIGLYEQRMKKFKKKVPIYASDAPQQVQIANLYRVLVQLEEETFKIHQTYQSRISNYTLENTELRQKVNCLEKTVNALSQSQNDNQSIISKMKLQGERIAELNFQNEQMREVLKDRKALENRVKELVYIDQKQKEIKAKEEKEAKKRLEQRVKDDKERRKTTTSDLKFWGK